MVISMNKFKKYCPNVWIAECEEEYEKGEIIQLETKYGKEVDCKVYNYLGMCGENFLYSIQRIEDMSYAERKAERYNNAAKRSLAKSNEQYNASQEYHEFLSLGEPIKIGHHSEKRHRAMIEKTNKRMDKCVEYAEKAKEQENKAKYWEEKAEEITLAMPESLEYFEFKLSEITEYHRKLKSGEAPREHQYSLTYAKKDMNDLKKKVEIAKALWG